MSNFTPADIADALHRADIALEELATQFAWLKGQRDHWRDVYDYKFARAKVMDDGPVGKSKEAAECAVNRLIVEIPWLPGSKITLAQMRRLTESSFDLVSKAYSQMESHISILQTVNKNVLLDYGRA